MDRVSDDRLDELIKFMEWQMFSAVVNCLKELKARRESERRPDPLSQALNEGDEVYRP